jgi:transcriptional regulator with XRE-family HTH domain
MDIDRTAKTMTAKEIADALGVSQRTVQRAAASALPGKQTGGKTARYTEGEAFSIAGKVQPRQPRHTDVAVDAARIDRIERAIESLTDATAAILAILPRLAAPVQSVAPVIAAPVRPLPVITRPMVNSAAREAANRTGKDYGEVYPAAYHRLHLATGFNATGEQARYGSGSILETVERCGYLPQVLEILEAMV